MRESVLSDGEVMRDGGVEARLRNGDHKSSVELRMRDESAAQEGKRLLQFQVNPRCCNIVTRQEGRRNHATQARKWSSHIESGSKRWRVWYSHSGLRKRTNQLSIYPPNESILSQGMLLEKVGRNNLRNLDGSEEAATAAFEAKENVDLQATAGRNLQKKANTSSNVQWPVLTERSRVNNNSCSSQKGAMIDKKGENPMQQQL